MEGFELATPLVSTRTWSLNSLVEASENFCHVPRIALSAAVSRLRELEHVEEPVIIEGLHEHPCWPADMFNVEWLSMHGPKDINVRNVHDRSDTRMPFNEFIAKSRAAPIFSQLGEFERFYGKDAECPPQWCEWLHRAGVVPEILLPEVEENLLHLQPEAIRVETLMCYLGIGDTHTPCHKDLCASSGQNLMCYAENGGSSFWIMTRGSDALHASKYFHRLKQELDHECHVITFDELACAPFKIYIAEQQVGDLVLVPPRSCHQVVNHGGITIKTSWSRLTLQGLEIAFYHELPIYRRVCRPEIYRVKSTIHHTLLRETAKFKVVQAMDSTLAAGSRLRKLLRLYETLLIDEYSPDHAEIYCAVSSRRPNSELENDHLLQVTCDFCGADIFQGFFECRNCVSRNESHSSEQSVACGDGFAICAGCYVEGRSCKCGHMEPIQCQPFTKLLRDYQMAAEVLASGDIDMWNPHDSQSIGTFEAACILQKSKTKEGIVKMCNRGYKEPNHAIPQTSALTCRKCHNSRCFQHLLAEQKLHTVEAILLHSRDPSHERYHQHHLHSRTQYEDGIQILSSAQAQGNEPNFSLQRVFNATTYPSCQPINLTFSSLGFYDVLRHDVHALEIEEPHTLPTIEQTSRLDMPVSQGPISQPKTRSRQVLDYVHVPPAKFRIRSNPCKSGKNIWHTDDLSSLTSISSHPTPPPSKQVQRHSRNGSLTSGDRAVESSSSDKEGSHARRDNDGDYRPTIRIIGPRGRSRRAVSSVRKATITSSGNKGKRAVKSISKRRQNVSNCDLEAGPSPGSGVVTPAVRRCRVPSGLHFKKTGHQGFASNRRSHLAPSTSASTSSLSECPSWS